MKQKIWDSIDLLEKAVDKNEEAQDALKVVANALNSANWILEEFNDSEDVGRHILSEKSGMHIASVDSAMNNLFT